MPSAEIITIGTEILLGEIVDTNTRFIANTLRQVGIDLFRTHAVGDNVERISTCIRDSLSYSDIVITTGGLGPTVDDPTRQAVAVALSRELDFNPVLWEQISSRIAQYGRSPLTENQKRQAFLPRGAIPFSNPVGTAPAFVMEIDQPASDLKVIVSLPGVPMEMETLLEGTAIPYLVRRFNLREVIQVRILHTCGIGEALLDEKIGGFETLTNPTVGLTAHSGLVDIRITAKSSNLENANTLISQVETEIRKLLGDKIFGADLETLEGAISNLFTQLGWTLSCFEYGITNGPSAHLKKYDNGIFRGCESHPIENGELSKELIEVQQKYKTDAALGVVVNKDKDYGNVLISIILPNFKKDYRFRYGGHPKNSSKWATNTALDLLRSSAIEISK